MQINLLRVLQEWEIMRVENTKRSIQIDIHIIAATNKDPRI